MVTYLDEVCFPELAFSHVGGSKNFYIYLVGPSSNYNRVSTKIGAKTVEHGSGQTNRKRDLTPKSCNREELQGLIMREFHALVHTKRRWCTHGSTGFWVGSSRRSSQCKVRRFSDALWCAFKIEETWFFFFFSFFLVQMRAQITS